ncbi:MAG TPA: DUF4262 domain-containing protein [Gemmatimonadaceae bacterium]|nr:DUF4262 domain-containing protein [Gemmatimonadaceae bacterium]
MNEHEAQTLTDIDRFGWTVWRVSNDKGPDFAYSVGMFRSLDHPEILIFGMPLDTMHQLINDIGARVRQGARYSAGEVSSLFLDGYDVMFRAIPKFQYGGHLGWAKWLYGGEDFPALQMIYPDREGRWPWDSSVDHSFRDNQPVLADISTPPWSHPAT